MKRRHNQPPVVSQSSATTLSPASISRFGECACFKVRRFNRVLTQHFATALRASELEATQLPVLARIAAQPVTLAQLADWLAMDRTTLLRNLKPLERHGWIEDITGNDGRARSLRVTAAGRRQLVEVEPVWRRAQARVLAAFAPGEWDGFSAKMEDVATHLEKVGGAKK
jgi:DNA-binding MarR family transcriptional regulator